MRALPTEKLQIWQQQNCLASTVEKKDLSKMTPATTPVRANKRALLANTDDANINDDAAERFESRRRTIMTEESESRRRTLAASNMTEESESLKKCLEMFNGNKLSRDNAWKLSLIDTVQLLLDRHHTTLRNFGVAGNSLEASSRVYSLRVDSLHIDVMRMAAGLNAKKFSEADFDDIDEGAATGGEGNADPSASAAGADGTNDAANTSTATQQQKPKRARKQVCTITKNKETINGKLETHSLPNPLFAKLNAISGSINSSNRLMNNVLPTKESVLQLNTHVQFWDNNDVKDMNYCDEDNYEQSHLSCCDKLLKIQNLEQLQLRAKKRGYIIDDVPEEHHDDTNSSSEHSAEGSNYCDGGIGDCFSNAGEVAMAFDMNAICEPMPMDSEPPPILDVDFHNFEELSNQEFLTINRCRGLQHKPQILEDLRPIDSSSNLEYSYRAFGQISQYWAGPSHWKFRRPTSTRNTLMPTQRYAATNNGSAVNTQRCRQKRTTTARRIIKEPDVSKVPHELYTNVSNYKGRCANIQKKWDQRKLKLPIDMRIPVDYFARLPLMPYIVLHFDDGAQQSLLTPDDDDGSSHVLRNSANASAANADVDDAPLEHFVENDMDDGGLLNSNNDNNLGSENFNTFANNNLIQSATMEDSDANNSLVLVIPTQMENAPTQVQKIIVPFAKRAKPIDMKNLKLGCAALLNKELSNHIMPEEEAPKHPLIKIEKYVPGVASFKTIYKRLPEVLTKSMREAISISIALYSMLHLANEQNLRLIQHEDLNDFSIRRIASATHATESGGDASMASTSAAAFVNTAAAQVMARRTIYRPSPLAVEHGQKQQQQQQQQQQQPQ